jgi:hypothetical protein
VLAPGIGFHHIPGWDKQKAPHAWIAGGQTTLLKNQIQAMPDNGTFVMTVPKSPYRCPPGPYERACLVADYLIRTKGQYSKVIVLDANAGIQAEKETFSHAFNSLYINNIEYHTDVELEAVDADQRVAITSKGNFQSDVLNVIGNQRSPGLIHQSGLTDGGDWAPVDPLSYASTLAGFERVHVIGDSQATNQPKSGHMANAEAKVCADAIIRQINGEPLDSPERMASITTNSACFSPITNTKASWLTAGFAYDPASGQMKLVPDSLGEAENWSRGSYRDMFTWADNIFADTFS